MPSMIFHYPAPLPRRRDSGAAVRIHCMAAAFEELGYRVELVAGRRPERRARIRELQAEIAQGRQFDFAYSESINRATILAEVESFPVPPGLDFAFLASLKRRRIPVGLFYRDTNLGVAREYELGDTGWRRVARKIRHRLTRPLHLYDYYQYRNVASHLFLPSAEMADLLPGRWPAHSCSALPPGCTIPADSELAIPGSRPGRLELLYIGNVLPPTYDLRPGLAALAGLEGIHLTLCCQAAKWQGIREWYGPLDPQVTVVHCAGDDLKSLFTGADAFYYAVEDHPYLQVAMPVKVFEAMSYGLPLIAYGDTCAGRLVEQEGSGWQLPGVAELREFLCRLRDNPSILRERQQSSLAARARHTWEARAAEAAQVLMTLPPRSVQPGKPPKSGQPRPPG